MDDKSSALRVVRKSVDGRRRYDEKSKRLLVEAALRPGVSVARLAQEHGINANLLRKWITKHLMQREQGVVPVQHNADDNEPPSNGMDGVPIDLPGSRQGIAAAVTHPTFVPVVSMSSAPATAPPSQQMPMTIALHVWLSNGVELELGKVIATIDELTTLVQILGRMPCSDSTKA